VLDIEAVRFEARVMLGALELTVLVVPPDRGVLVRTGERECVDLALPPRHDDAVVLVDLASVLSWNRIRLLVPPSAPRRDRAERRSRRTRRRSAKCHQNTRGDRAGVAEKLASRHERTAVARMTFGFVSFVCAA